MKRFLYRTWARQRGEGRCPWCPARRRFQATSPSFPPTEDGWYEYFHFFFVSFSLSSKFTLLHLFPSIPFSISILFSLLDVLLDDASKLHHLPSPLQRMVGKNIFSFFLSLFLSPPNSLSFLSLFPSVPFSISILFSRLDVLYVQEVVTPFYIVGYYIIWVTTSWTDGTTGRYASTSSSLPPYTGWMAILFFLSLSFFPLQIQSPFFYSRR